MLASVDVGSDWVGVWDAIEFYCRTMEENMNLKTWKWNGCVRQQKNWNFGKRLMQKMVLIFLSWAASEPTDDFYCWKYIWRVMLLIRSEVILTIYNVCCATFEGVVYHKNILNLLEGIFDMTCFFEKI